MTEYTSQGVEFVEKRVLGGERREGERQRQRGRDFGGKRELRSGQSLSLKGIFAPVYKLRPACHTDCARSPRDARILTVIVF